MHRTVTFVESYRHQMMNDYAMGTLRIHGIFICVKFHMPNYLVKMREREKQ